MERQAGLIADPTSSRWPVWQSVYAIWCGVTLFLAWDASPVVVAIVAACFGLGVFLVWHGLRVMTGERAFRAEWLRAQDNWEELRKGAASASSQGHSLDDYLRSLGYRVPGVIRAIAHDLSAECASE